MLEEVIIFLIIGIVQGCLEWLPVSSQAFLFIILIMFGVNPMEAFLITIVLHLGTALSSLIYYRKEYINMITNFYSDPSAKRVFTFYVIGIITTGVVVLPIYLVYKKLLESLGHLIFIGALLILLLIGLAMLLVGFFMRLAQKSLGQRKKDEINYKDAFLFGAFQALAIIPGVSRSGITISVLLARKIDKKVAVDLSFSVAPFVIIGGIFFDFLVLEKGNIDLLLSPNLIAAGISTFVTSFLTIKYFTKLVERINFSTFLIVMGSLLLVLNGLAVAFNFSF